MTVSGFLRIAVKAALTQQPLMLPSEVATIDAARDEFRRAAVNLDSLLRQTYLSQSGVMGNGPAEDDFWFVLTELRQNAARLKLVLDKLP